MMKNDKRSAFIGQFQDINKLMEEQLEKWNSIAEIRKTYDEFIRNLKKLRDLQPDLERNLGPVQEDLRYKQEQLIAKVFPVANVLAVYGADRKIKKSNRYMKIHRADLQQMKPGKLLELASKTLKTTEKFFPDTEQEEGELTRYGLTAAMVEEFSSALTKYSYALHLSKDLLRNRNRSKKLSNRLLKANRELLDKRMDRLMTVFSITHPSFYTDYTSIRKSNLK
jgi:hypothetical protein